MFHSLLAVWFRLSLQWGYPGIFLFMAIESTVFPLPSEIVIPPAAYWATQGRFSMGGVVLAATLGSWVGSTVSYWVARSVGRPVILRYGYGGSPGEVAALRSGGSSTTRWPGSSSRDSSRSRALHLATAGAARVPFGRFSLTTLRLRRGAGARVVRGKVLENSRGCSRIRKRRRGAAREADLVVVAATMLALYVLNDVVGLLRARAPTT
jgi:hypothetical protein